MANKETSNVYFSPPEHISLVEPFRIQKGIVMGAHHLLASYSPHFFHRGLFSCTSSPLSNIRKEATTTKTWKISPAITIPITMIARTHGKKFASISLVLFNKTREISWRWQGGNLNVQKRTYFSWPYDLQTHSHHLRKVHRPTIKTLWHLRN